MAELVVLSLERWDDVWRRNQYLVDGLLRADPELRVLFVEPPDDPVHDMRSGRRPETGSRLTQIGDRLWRFRPVKWLPRRLDAQADARMARAARRAAVRLGFIAPMLWINDPAATDLAEQTGWPVLYDMTDDWLAADRAPAERERITRGETWLLQHASAVVACSPELVRRKESQRADIALVRNGVDTARYRMPMPRPSDLPPGSYALYVGTLHRDRIDVELVEQTARALDGVGRLVLVGPEAWSPTDAARVRAAGAVVLGARARDLIPGYLQHASVLTVPHLVTEFTESLDPIKLYEYQAVGRPIVSAPVAGFRDAADVHVAEADAYVAAVAASMTGASQGVGPTLNAESLDWSQRVSEFRDALTRL